MRAVIIYDPPLPITLGIALIVIGVFMIIQHTSDTVLYGVANIIIGIILVLGTITYIHWENTVLQKQGTTDM